VSRFDERLAAWFEGRRWRVMDEVSGTVIVGGVQIDYANGEFEIASPGVYVTPLGNRGRRGYLVIETDADGHDLPAHAEAFGEATLRRALLTYGLVAGLPEEDG
jgi:hypothetical protein